MSCMYQSRNFRTASSMFCIGCCCIHGEAIWQEHEVWPVRQIGRQEEADRPHSSQPSKEAREKTGVVEAACISKVIIILVVIVYATDRSSVTAAEHS